MSNSGPLTTCAQRASPPERLSVRIESQRQLGFTILGQIDLFEVGDRKPLRDVTDPDEIDLDRLSSSDSIVYFRQLGFAKEQLDTLYRFNQLGLFYSICTNANLVPGRSWLEDSRIDDALKEKLCPLLCTTEANVNNIILEFRQYWNTIARLEIARTKLGQCATVDNSHLGPQYTYHANYEDTVNAFCNSLWDSIESSDTYQSELAKDGPVDPEKIRTLNNFLRTHFVKVFAPRMINPRSLSYEVISLSVMANIAAEILNPRETRRPVQSLPARDLFVRSERERERERDNDDTRGRASSRSTSSTVRHISRSPGRR